MSATRIAAANVAITHDKEANLNKFIELIGEAASEQVSLLVFPEMGLQGYADFAFRFGSPEDAEQRRFFFETSETIPGPATERVQQALDGSDLYVQLGLAERTLNGNIIFNSTAIVGPEGVVGVYRKVHNQFEYPYFMAGNSAPTFDLPIGAVGSLICYDAAFPEFVRTLALQGAIVVLMSTAWPLKGENPENDYHAFAMDLAVRSNAFFNQLWIVVSNHCEKGAYSQHVNYYGNSQIVSPRGQVVALLGSEEGLVIHEADLEAEVLTARTQAFFGHNFLQDRRPEVYAPIADPTEEEPTQRLELTPSSEVFPGN